ncbi:antitoxin Xre/MbcA/ParS toxin-binding domain-containing protein [Luteimonas sp. A482]
MSEPIPKQAPRPAPKRAGTTIGQGKKAAFSVRDAASAKSAKQRPPVKAFRALLRTAPLTERIRIEREGVPSKVVKALIDQIGVSSTDFQVYVGIPKATFTKKMREQQQFAGATGQSVVGFMDLLNRVEDMLAAEQDNPEAADFDVEKWVGGWIQRPQPALGGMTPAELMDTPSGRESVMRVLGAIQSGAYQ